MALALHENAAQPTAAVDVAAGARSAPRAITSAIASLAPLEDLLGRDGREQVHECGRRRRSSRSDGWRRARPRCRRGSTRRTGGSRASAGRPGTSACPP